MMWMFQRVVFGRAPGEMPDPHDGELTADERAACSQASGAVEHGHGGHHGHGAMPAVSAARTSGADDPRSRTSTTVRSTFPACTIIADPHEHDDRLAGSHPDRAGYALPLAVLTIVFGVYPKPIFDIVGPTFERILLPFRAVSVRTHDTDRAASREWSKLSGSC